MLPVLKYNGKEIAKNIEFAKTKLQQTLGLMFRKSIPSDFSMIFILKKPSSVNDVVEMKAGTIERYNISIGGQMEFKDI